MRLNHTWEFNVLGIYNYRVPGKLSDYFDFIYENHSCLEGDLVEFGVFKGSSILATALFLKEIGSKKKVFGFDSFSGFPPIYHPKDDLAVFDELQREGRISLQHHEMVNKLRDYRRFMKNAEIDVKNISSSEQFSENSLASLKRKIDYLKLDNIELIEGPFSDTLKRDSVHRIQVMGGLFDCDLYNSYLDCLNFVWPRSCLGAYFFLDEYYSLKFAGARVAVDEFCENLFDKPRKIRNDELGFERWYLLKTKQ